MASTRTLSVGEKNPEITQHELDSVRQIVNDWIKNRGDAEWLDRTLAADFRFSTFLFQKPLRKEEFIKIVSTTPATLKVVSVVADAVGKIVVARLVLDVIDEDFTADLGPGMPTGKEIEEAIVGRRLVYISAFRREGIVWRCYDHHQIGPVD